MAVSHQWFIHWSPPSMLFADITKEYTNVNPNFDARTNPLDVNVKNSDAYLQLDQSDHYNQQDQYENKLKESSSAAGVTLWLTLLGLAQPPPLPEDREAPPFNTLYKWKFIDFEFPSQRHRRQAVISGKYLPRNVLPLGLEVYRDRIFVTIPSWRRGVPATLATVPRAGDTQTPLLRPYPNWNYHRLLSTRNCTGLTSVFRITADPCGRLWVMDSGQIDSQDDPKQICPPSIVVFDLNTDQELARYEIPQKYVLQDSLFSNIVVDTSAPDCSDLHVYIADTWRFGLIVFRQSDGEFWRFTNPFFYPDPLASNYTLHGINFHWTDGIFGLALTPNNQFNDRLLFFHSMSSYREFYVPTYVLKNELQVNESVSEFHLTGESRGEQGHSSASAIDRRGVMFYGLVTRDTIGCWDTKKPYERTNLGVVAKDSESLVFPNDMKVDQEAQQSVWVLSNRLPLFQEDRLDYDSFNYRIMYADAEEAVRGTVCDPNLPATPTLSIRRRG